MYEKTAIFICIYCFSSCVQLLFSIYFDYCNVTLECRGLLTTMLLTLFMPMDWAIVGCSVLYIKAGSRELFLADLDCGLDRVFLLQIRSLVLETLCYPDTKDHIRIILYLVSFL